MTSDDDIHDPTRADHGRPAPESERRDGRGHEPGAHPEVERSGRSSSTAIALAAVMAGAFLMYLVIWIGIINPPGV